MTNERMIELLGEVLSQIEGNAGAIFVRESVGGKVGNFSLLELPADRVIHHICKFIRTRFNQAASEESSSHLNLLYRTFTTKYCSWCHAYLAGSFTQHTEDCWLYGYTKDIRLPDELRDYLKRLARPGSTSPIDPQP